jgi:DNA-binding response OmpR family regulator
MINILLIEDDPFWAKEISGSFDKEKFKVVHFDKIKNSINYINNNNDFNIILLDLCLPDSPDPFSTLNSVVPLSPNEVITTTGV